MFVLIVLIIVCYFSNLCEAQTSYNTGYIIQTIYSDSKCSVEYQKQAVVLNQCIYLNDPTFNDIKILSAGVGVTSVKYKWDISIGLMPMDFYSDTACQTVVSSSTKTKSTTGLLFNTLDKCSQYNAGSGSFKMTYVDSYSGALSSVQSISNYTMTYAYSSQDICTGKSSSNPVYISSTKINTCYADTGVTSVYTSCVDRNVYYGKEYTNDKCSDLNGYKGTFTYIPSCSDDSFDRFIIIDSANIPHRIVGGYVSTQCGVYDDGFKITAEFVLPIALAAFFFSISLCLCCYIFWRIHQGAMSPPPKLTKSHYELARV